MANRQYGAGYFLVWGVSLSLVTYWAWDEGVLYWGVDTQAVADTTADPGIMAVLLPLIAFAAALSLGVGIKMLFQPARSGGVHENLRGQGSRYSNRRR